MWMIPKEPAYNESQVTNAHVFKGLYPRSSPCYTNKTGEDPDKKDC